MNTLLIIVIAVSLLVVLAALILVARRVYTLYKVVNDVRHHVDNEIQVIMAGQERALGRLESIQRNQALIEERSARLSANMNRLSYLSSEFSGAKSRLTTLQ